MEEGSWQSEIGQGYSVDNLARATPMGLEVTEGNLVWEIVPAEDLTGFDIYLDGEYWQTTIWQQIEMIGVLGVVGIISVDIHGNESETSELLYGGFNYGEIELPWADWREQLADVDANGSIEAYDAGLIDEFPVENAVTRNNDKINMGKKK
ncbi:MAG: hypothetical protein P9X26_08990 [Candidatus Stygibacter frigidus]|nr:hypothetical protein [Candidatus Stygibacter frigidus]